MTNSLKARKNITQNKYLFETPRLGFRLLNEEDIQNFEKLDSDEKLERYLPELQNLDRFASRISEFINQYQNKGLPCFAIIELETGNYAGGCGFAPMEKGAEVGYIFLKNYWGKGYATESLAALLKWAKKNLDSEYIIAYTFAEHVASCRVLEKAGMKFYKVDGVKGIQCRFYHKKNK